MKRTRPFEWLIGYWLISLIGAIGPAWVAWHYFAVDWRLVGLGALCITLGAWASAGMLYHEAGRANLRWAKRLTVFGQTLAIVGLIVGFIGVLLMLFYWLKSRI